MRWIAFSLIIILFIQCSSQKKQFECEIRAVQVVGFDKDEVYSTLFLPNLTYIMLIKNNSSDTLTFFAPDLFEKTQSYTSRYKIDKRSNFQLIAGSKNYSMHGKLTSTDSFFIPKKSTQSVFLGVVDSVITATCVKGDCKESIVDFINGSKAFVIVNSDTVYCYCSPNFHIKWGLIRL